MPIHTGKGDRGYTDLHFQRRISKDSLDIAAIGELDELDSFLGLVKCKIRSKAHKDIIEKIQAALVAISSEISVGPDKGKTLGVLLTKLDADWIKKTVIKLEKKINPERCFHTPGGNELAATIDIARAVARRAERIVVSLFKRDRVRNDHVLTYMNCISDVLFLLERDASRTKNR